MPKVINYDIDRTDISVWPETKALLEKLGIEGGIVTAISLHADYRAGEGLLAVRTSTVKREVYVWDDVTVYRVKIFKEQED